VTGCHPGPRAGRAFARRPGGGAPRLLLGKLPPGTRLLGENAFAYAALAGTGYEVVPVWSSEVSFLFGQALDPRAACRLLEECNIRAVVYNPVSLSTHYLQRASPLYADAPQGWKPLLALNAGNQRRKCVKRPGAWDTRNSRC